jgi:antitoxin HicB
MKFTVILTSDSNGGGYAAECPTIPGCISEGDTVEQAMANIKEAIEGCLESMAAKKQHLPAEQTIIVTTVDAEAPSPDLQKKAKALKLVEEAITLKKHAKTTQDYERLADLYNQIEILYEPE